MNTYFSLSNVQALKLGWLHNEIHSASKVTIFEEQVILFGNILESVQKDNPNTVQRTLNGEWRSEIAQILNKEKSELKKKYRPHIYIVLHYHTRCWFIYWTCSKPGDRKITKQPNKEIKQMHLTNLYKLDKEEEEEKKEMFKRLGMRKDEEMSDELRLNELERQKKENSELQSKLIDLTKEKQQTQLTNVQCIEGKNKELEELKLELKDKEKKLQKKNQKNETLTQKIEKC
ncbi:unnamed protein product [Mytilus coruscus]|uniref:Uncharacterized protein n=1 Tax=Mytilus coruscus TaxID=42192 RepID=A0A6J8DXV4_MYTCO|nr:unnamed protein product [Mytilus coruscus]